MKNKLLSQLYESCKKWKTLVLLGAMLLIGTNQMWGAWYIQGTGGNLNAWGNGVQMTQGTYNTNVYYHQVSGSCEFKITSEQKGYANEKNGSKKDNRLGNVTLSGDNNITGNGGSTWYICYTTASDKVYGTTSNPDIPPTYTVSYNSNGGTGSTSSHTGVSYNSSVTLRACGATKSGYHFAGWNTQSGGGGTSYAAGASYTVTSDITLYAQWVKTIYVLDDASFSTLYLYTWGSKSIGDWPGKGTSTDYVNSLGSNWYEVNIPDGAGSFIINNNNDKQTVDLTASNFDDGASYHFTGPTDSKYNLVSKTLTVTVNMHGQGSDPGYAGSYNYNALITEDDEPSASGYTFDGWFKESTYDNEWDFANDHVTSDLTLHAKWTVSSTRTLTYHANYYYDGTGTSGSVPAAQVVAINATATVADRNTLAMTNYTFSGWNTEEYITGDDYAVGSSITMDEDKDLYAVWTRSFTLNQNGATTNGTTSVTGTYNCSTLPPITNPSKTGYDFNGWRTENNGSGNLAINTSGELQSGVHHWTDETTPSNRFQRYPTSISPLYAWWTQTVTLKANTDNHGSGTDQTATATWNKTSISIPTHCSAASGYSLDGYYTAATDGTKIINANKSFAGTNITNYITSGKWTKEGATTLWAQFTPNNYTIMLNDNGGSGGDGSHAVTFNSATGSLTNAPEKDGYTFAGYWTGSGGTGTQIFNADLTPIQNVSGYTDNTSDKKWIYAGSPTLYAKWTEIKYTVTLVNATASSVSAGCATHPSITASTAPFGMKFDHWDVSGGASVASTTSNPTTVSATAAGTVTAVYTQGLYAYIVCRFETHSKDRQTTYYTGNWNTTATNNEFEYDEANHRFVKHTYTTLAELSANKDGQPQYFEVKTTEAHGNLDHSSVKYYGKSSNTNITTTGYDNRIAMELSEATGHPKFSGSTTDKYVVIYFDENKELWFEEEDIPAVINNISLSDNVVPPGASITATPSMYVRGAVNKAYCWGVYTDEECTEGNKVDVSFNSIGGGKVDFTVPLTTGTYYLKLKVHASAACDVAVDDSKVVSFEVTTTKMIYFKNVPNWSNVYVYFYYGNGASGYWNSSKGTGPMKGGDDRVCSASTMKRIGKSDIYYYQYDTWSGHVVAFADHVENDNEFFDQSQVAYREDFSTCAQMYVPENYIHDYLNEHDSYRTCYYSSNNDNKIRGYWTTYPRVNAGFTIKLYGSADGSQEGEDIAFTQTGTNTYVANVNLDPATHATYYYDLHTCAGDNGVSNTKYTHYGNSGEMKINSSDNWNFYTQIARCRITPAAAGTYKFKLLLSDDGAVQVSVEYPLAVGDYRLVYTDEDHTLHPSRFIRARADGLDTISVWINPDAESSVLKVQQCTAVSPKIIWSNYNWSGSDATGAIDISGYSRGVYNFYLTQNGSNELSVETSKTAPYTGLYYIRCSSVGGGWLGYKTNSDNLMTYTKYAEDKNYGFNYYKAKWVNDAGSDVTYTIACDYSESLCDTLVADAGDDPLNASQAVSIPHNANIRFGWNSLDNTLQRAYINGSTNASDRYLVLKGEHDKIVDENGNAFSVSGLNADETTFVDLNNWIYRVDLKAKPNGGVKVIANYNGNEQFFIGDADNFEKIIGSSEDQWWPLRVTYDFKTNRLMTAWLPSGSQITSNIALNADMMLIREGQNAATQVFFNGSGKAISDIHTIYGVMEFQYDNIVGKFPTWGSPNAYKYLMYYISFPFDVKVSEIFGCGVRGENWIVQKYNGAKRARIGWFAETSTFWETMEGSETMNAYEGYLLLLDRISFNDSGSSLWFKQGEGNSIYLYFPSTSVASGTISEDETTIHVPEHTCTIDRTFDVGGVGTVSHKNTDSHWNVIGTPLFEDKEATTIATPSADGAGATTLQYYYAWNSADNTLAAQAAFDDDVEFKSMHGYMVQYAGDVTFIGAKLTPPPASVAARHIPGDKKNYRIKLRMMNEDGNRSETFVELRENACDTFALNEDMYMMRSSTTVDLYTFAGAYDVAANVLSMNNHIVPVGMDVKRAGTYRFTMPSDFSGTVTLIDTEADVRTNLAYGDYEVNLPKGTSNNRFFLEINIQQMPTAIDGAGGSLKDGKAHKFIENGQMYILQNGAIYDARGNRVR